MFNPANQAHFHLQFAGDAPTLQVLAFEGRDALSTPFAFDITG